MVQTPDVRLVTEQALATFRTGPVAADIAAVKTQVGFTPARRPVLKGVPLCVGFRSTGLSVSFASAQTVQVTTKWSGIVGFDANDLRVVFSNWRTNQYNEAVKPYQDVLPELPMTLRAGIVIAGVTYQLTVNGKRDFIVEPGGFIESDPIPVDVKAGDVIRTVTYQAAGNWRVLGSIANPAFAGDGAGVTTTGDYTADASALPADGGGSGIMPCAITATPKNKRQRTVCIVGASDAEGVGDGYLQNGYNFGITQARHGRWGFISRALTGVTGVLQTARTGDRVSTLALLSGHRGRFLLMSSCSEVIDTMGLNDVFQADTLANIQANKILVWGMESAKGCRVWGTTWTPNSTSTDNWKTTANQSVTAIEAVRVGFNDWIRDGSPITIATGIAAAVGSVGAGVMRSGVYVAGVFTPGNPLHPLYGYYEVADKAESARNSGKWRVAQIVTKNDFASTNGSNVYTSASTTFTNADLWSLYEIAGAGPGGTALRGYVQAFTAHTVTLYTTSGAVVNASATLAGLTGTMKLPTVDGLHGTNDLHEIMQTAIDTSVLLGG
jgi:hypothetical protein